MADIYVKFEDGTSHVYNDAPDSISQADAISRAQKDFGKTVAEVSRDKSTGVGNYSAGLVKGAANIGATLLRPVDWAARQIGVSNDYVGYQPEERKRLITEGIKSAAEAMGGQVNPESTAFKAGELTTEVAGTLGVPGAVARPFMVAGKTIPAAANVGRAIESAGFEANTNSKLANALLRVGGGATAGGASAALVNPDEAGSGAAFGSLLGVAAKPIGNAIGRTVEWAGRKLKPVSEGAIGDYQQQIASQVAESLGIDVDAMPQQLRQIVDAEAAKALKTGKSLDPVVLARKADFESLGMQPLLGQITRDPAQFAQERNLRAAGAPIQERLTQQNIKLQEVFGSPAEKAVSAQSAGKSFVESLARQDEAAKKQVNNLYQAAKSKDGRFAEVDHIAFINKANDSLDSEMLGRFLPEQARNLLNDVAAGKMPLNVNNLVQLDSVLSAAQRSADDAGALAIGKVRDALHSAPISSGAGAEAKAAFDVARNAARGRFSAIEQNPALKAVVEGKASPDKFVSQYIINGDADKVKTLAAALRKDSPEVFTQAKAQMAEDIRRAAFGEGVTGDAAIRPEALAKKLRELKDKLPAFFEPEEIGRYETAMRVANYIEKHPNAAPVNTSNTLTALLASPVIGALERVPVIGGAVGLAKAGARTVKNEMATTRAMNSKVPTEKAELSESTRKNLARLLGISGSVAGVLGQ